MPTLPFSKIREIEHFSSSEKQAMFFRRTPGYSLVFMGVNHPKYIDVIKDGGSTIEYMGHFTNNHGGEQIAYRDKEKSITNENGQFLNAAFQYMLGLEPPERVKVYRQVSSNWDCECLGFFSLIGCWKAKVFIKKYEKECLVYKFLLRAE